MIVGDRYKTMWGDVNLSALDPAQNALFRSARRRKDGQLDMRTRKSRRIAHSFIALTYAAALRRAANTTRRVGLEARAIAWAKYDAEKVEKENRRLTVIAFEQFKPALPCWVDASGGLDFQYVVRDANNGFIANVSDPRVASQIVDLYNNKDVSNGKDEKAA